MPNDWTRKRRKPQKLSKSRLVSGLANRTGRCKIQKGRRRLGGDLAQNSPPNQTIDGSGMPGGSDTRRRRSGRKNGAELDCPSTGPAGHERNVNPRLRSEYRFHPTVQIQALPYLSPPLALLFSPSPVFRIFAFKITKSEARRKVKATGSSSPLLDPSSQCNRSVDWNFALVQRVAPTRMEGQDSSPLLSLGSRSL